MSQKKIIKNILESEGQVYNASAFKGLYGGRPILRLGAIIHSLKADGLDIRTDFKNVKGRRNCRYWLVEKEPQQLNMSRAF